MKREVSLGGYNFCFHEAPLPGSDAQRQAEASMTVGAPGYSPFAMSLGSAQFDALPKGMRTFHGREGGRVTGSFTITRGPGFLRSALATIGGLPKPCVDSESEVTCVPDGADEGALKWARTFGEKGNGFSSTLRFEDGLCWETPDEFFGILHFGLHMQELREPGAVGFRHGE